MRRASTLSPPLPPLRLVDGPLVLVSNADMAKRMAADLMRFDAWRNRQDAIRCLFACAIYKSLDIAYLVDDARQVAEQHIVAREMSAR